MNRRQFLKNSNIALFSVLIGSSIISCIREETDLTELETNLLKKTFKKNGKIYILCNNKSFKKSNYNPENNESIIVNGMYINNDLISSINYNNPKITIKKIENLNLCIIKFSKSIELKIV